MKAILATLLCFTTFTPLFAADKWPPPETELYYSSDSTYVVRIVPRILPEKYWEWVMASADEKADFTPSDTLITPCQATMLKKTASGDSVLWTKALINRVAPVNAFVSDDGKYLVTFDNWHSLGLGKNVFVYYNENGDVLQSLTLDEISPFPISDYLRTVSSLRWSCGTRFIDTRRIEICFLNQDKKEQKIIYNLGEQRIE